MRIKRKIGLLIVGITLSMLSSACAEAPVPVVEPFGCRENIRGVNAVIKPETSGVHCTDIKNLIFGLPSEPQVYFIRGEKPHLRWKCRFYGTEQGSVLLRCEHNNRHFEIVKTSKQ